MDHGFHKPLCPHTVLYIHTSPAEHKLPVTLKMWCLLPTWDPCSLNYSFTQSWVKNPLRKGPEHAHKAPAVLEAHRWDALYWQPASKTPLQRRLSNGVHSFGWHLPTPYSAKLYDRKRWLAKQIIWSEYYQLGVTHGRRRSSHKQQHQLLIAFHNWDQQAIAPLSFRIGISKQ